MATNPKTVPIANKVDDAQLQTLASGGSITKGGDTYTADERALYLTEETIDTTPTANSDNLVTSGGVYNALPTVNNPTITVTQGGVTKGSFTLNQSSSETIALDAGGGGSSTDVQINGTSITSGGVADIQTKGTYNASTNKIATESDLPAAVTITTTSGSESVSDGTNTLNFGANAFNSSAYAGGTAVTLNGTSAAGSTASFYAPTGAGTSGQILKSNGSGAPSWTDLYPVGAEYFSMDNTSPASVFGGTWALIGRKDTICEDTFSTATNPNNPNLHFDYIRRNGFVTINVFSYETQTLAGGVYNFMGTLPVGYRPMQDLKLSISFIGGAYVQNNAEIDTQGTFEIYVASIVKYFGVTATFPIPVDSNFGYVWKRTA